MNWKLWLEGLGSAALGGFVTGLVHAIGNGGQINNTTWLAGAAGALAAIALYLKPPATSPHPVDAPKEPPAK